MDNMPVIDESRGFRSPHLDDDADSYGTQDSGEFGTIPSQEGLLDDMRDDFSWRPGIWVTNISMLVLKI